MPPRCWRRLPQRTPPRIRSKRFPKNRYQQAAPRRTPCAGELFCNLTGRLIFIHGPLNEPDRVVADVFIAIGLAAREGQTVPTLQTVRFAAGGDLHRPGQRGDVDPGAGDPVRPVIAAADEQVQLDALAAGLRIKGKQPVGDDLSAAQPLPGHVHRPVQHGGRIVVAGDELLQGDVKPLGHAAEHRHGGVGPAALDLAPHALGYPGQLRRPINAEPLRFSDAVDVLCHCLLDIHSHFLHYPEFFRYYSIGIDGDCQERIGRIQKKGRPWGRPFGVCCDAVMADSSGGPQWCRCGSRRSGSAARC